MSGLFTPTASNKNDADGTAVTPLLEYRLFGQGTGLKAYGFGRLTYDMRDAASDNPTLAVTAAPGVEATTYAAVSGVAVGGNNRRDPEAVHDRQRQPGDKRQADTDERELEDRGVRARG
jgi:hypothetical protein